MISELKSLTTHSVESSFNILWNNYKWMQIFGIKSSLAMILIFILMTFLVDKIVDLGVKNIHK